MGKVEQIAFIFKAILICSCIAAAGWCAWNGDAVWGIYFVLLGIFNKITLRY